MTRHLPADAGSEDVPQDPNPSDCPPGLTLQDNSKCERVQARANEQPPDLTGV